MAYSSNPYCTTEGTVYKKDVKGQIWKFYS